MVRAVRSPRTPDFRRDREQRPGGALGQLDVRLRNCRTETQLVEHGRVSPRSIGGIRQSPTHDVLSGTSRHIIIIEVYIEADQARSADGDVPTAVHDQWDLGFDLIATCHRLRNPGDIRDGCMAAVSRALRRRSTVLFDP